MSVHGEIRLAVLGMLAVQIVTSFGAIALLGREGSGPVAMAGAWAMVILAMLGLGASAVALRRLRARIVAPILGLDAALLARGRGDALRRCRLDEAPLELRRIADAVGALMDPRDEGGEDPRDVAAADRAALLHLLDALPAPALVVNGRGVPLALSAAAHVRLETDEGGAIVKALGDAAAGRPAPGIASAAPIGGGALFLCTLG